jgi:hypothetical protein
MAPPLDRHAQNIGYALQEGDVVLGELALGLTVHFEHPERRAVALQYCEVGSQCLAKRRKQIARNPTKNRWRA